MLHIICRTNIVCRVVDLCLFTLFFWQIFKKSRLVPIRIIIFILQILQYLGFNCLRTVFLGEKNSENAFPENHKSNCTIRKCSSRAFQWMVMSVGFDNLILFGQFLYYLADFQQESTSFIYIYDNRCSFIFQSCSPGLQGSAMCDNPVAGWRQTWGTVQWK
jgi:hypothetical protein